MSERIFVLLAAGLICLAACGTQQDRAGETSDTDAAEQTAAVQEQAAAEDTFDLMDYSGLDTSSGVFYGEYDEKVNDEITVIVGLEVTLDQGRITDIALVDTQWVHPAAANQIPQRIIEQQRLPVDAVSGASVASWAIMTATALALEVDLMVLEEEDWSAEDEESFDDDLDTLNNQL